MTELIPLILLILSMGAALLSWSLCRIAGIADERLEHQARTVN